MTTADYAPETIETDDARDHFEGSAQHAIYTAASDLAGIGYTMEHLTAIIALAFLPVPVAGPVPVNAPF